ncbi:hypothetical protein [Synechococcus sp. EJ6-Ellesmere]|uniref:hypothetical protein n=1 Tax=Synechococcus sp. EJ6-Ellesmere TaxID=2823734 RepID=UPI0020CC4DD8|nr:hypothetical protein [Synechococcus sp. EJ6-Ellesmere]
MKTIGLVDSLPFPMRNPGESWYWMLQLQTRNASINACVVEGDLQATTVIPASGPLLQRQCLEDHLNGDTRMGNVLDS